MVSKPTHYVGMRLDSDIVALMNALKDRDGISFSEQVRRAIVAWLPTKGVPVKAKRRPAKKGVAA